MPELSIPLMGFRVDNWRESQDTPPFNSPDGIPMSSGSDEIKELKAFNSPDGILIKKRTETLLENIIFQFP